MEPVPLGTGGKKEKTPSNGLVRWGKSDVNAKHFLRFLKRTPANQHGEKREKTEKMGKIKYPGILYGTLS